MGLLRLSIKPHLFAKTHSSTWLINDALASLSFIISIRTIIAVVLFDHCKCHLIAFLFIRSFSFLSLRKFCLQSFASELCKNSQAKFHINLTSFSELHLPIIISCHCSTLVILPIIFCNPLSFHDFFKRRDMFASKGAIIEEYGTVLLKFRTQTYKNTHTYAYLKFTLKSSQFHHLMLRCFYRSKSAMTC